MNRQNIIRAIFVLFFFCFGVYCLPMLSRSLFTSQQDIAKSVAPAPSGERPFIIIGGYYPPYEDTVDGTTTGINPELLKPVFAKLGIPYEIRLYPWTRAWWMATNGKADAVISVSYKSSRENVLKYTQDQKGFASTGKIPETYLYLTKYVFFVLKKNQGKLRFDSYKQLIDDFTRIGTVRNFSYDPAFRAAIPKLNIKEYPTTKHALNALLKGEVDLVPLDVDVGKAIRAEMKAGETIDFLAKPLFVKPYHLVLLNASSHPQGETVVKAVARQYDQYRKDGTWERVFRKYTTRRKSEDQK